MVNSNRQSSIDNRQSMWQSSIENVAMRSALTLMLMAAPLLAQQPTFRTGTTLVEFTVVALDNKGAPVTDLTKEELVLTDGGRAREIAFFRFDGVPSPAADIVPAPVPPGFATNRLEYAAAPRQSSVTAIVLDLINTAPPHQTAARAQALKYLDSLPEDARVALFRFSEQEPMAALQTFTDRIDLIRAQIDTLKIAARRELTRPGWRGAPIVGADCEPDEGGDAQASQVAERADKTEGFATAAAIEKRQLSALNQSIRETRLAKTLASLEALGAHLAGIRGPKSVVWVTSGMPIMLSPTQEGQSLKNFEPLIRQAAQRLANQGIAVYPVDAKGACRALDRSRDQGAYGLNDPPERVFASLGVVADVTGGRFVKYENDPTHAVTIAGNDQRGTYTIGFYADDARKEEWQRLKVEVKRRGVTLRHREGYLAARSGQPQSWPPQSWQEMARRPLDSTAIRLNAQADVAGEGMTVLVHIAAGDLYFHEQDGRVVANLEVGLIERKGGEPTNIRVQPAEISPADPLKDQRTEMIPLKTTWPLNPGTTAVRVAVRDRFTGRYGTLELALSR
jgi:VWFA-related protein